MACHAVEAGQSGVTRHAAFVPSVPSGPGFTLRGRLQVQPDLLLSGPREQAALLTLFIVWASVGTPTTTPSADFRDAVTALAEPLSPGHPGRGADLPR